MVLLFGTVGTFGGAVGGKVVNAQVPILRSTHTLLMLSNSLKSGHCRRIIIQIWKKSHPNCEGVMKPSTRHVAPGIVWVSLPLFDNNTMKTKIKHFKK